MPAAPESSRVGAPSGETSSLLGDDVPKPEADESSAMRNFIGLCFAFGVSHACVVVGIAYASSVFDLTLGSVSTGLVYTLYTLTSLLAAAPFVDYVGPRNGMTLSMVGFLLYLGCFVAGQAVDGSNYSLECTVVIIGSICGGLSSSIGWVSQGVYYARSAVLHSQYAGISLGAANELLAGRFTAIYVGSQCATYTVSAVLLQETSMTDDDLFIILTLVIFITLLFWLFYCDDAPAPFGDDRRAATALASKSALGRALATTEFTFCNRRAVPLMWLTMAFGCASLFWSSYVNDETIDTYISTSAVAYLGAVQTGVVAALAIPAAWFSTRFGKVWILLLGSLSYVCLGGAYVVWTNKELGHWSSMVPLAMMYGLGRLTFESSAKAIYADLFPDTRAMAFASLNFVSGFCSSIFAYLLAGGIDNATVLGIIVMVPALLIVPGYLMATRTALVAAA